MKLSLLVSSVNCQFEELNRELPEGCLSEYEARACHSNCDLIFKECITHCNHDISCAEECITEDDTCTASCPCYVNCPGGCPCPKYSIWCPDKTCQKEHEVSFNYCVSEMEDVFIQCTFNCDPFDLQCHQLCATDYNNDLKRCPCGELCSNGCPCDKWSCHSEEPPMDHDDIHLLILNPQDDDSIPKSQQLKVSFFDFDTKLVEESHEVQLEKPSVFRTKRHNMCSFMNNGKMYLAGSDDKNEPGTTRLGQIDGNKIVYLDDLTKLKSKDNDGNKVSFRFAYGICTGDVGPGHHALLCHPIGHRRSKICWQWDGKHNKDSWKEYKTNYEHYKAGVAKWHHKKKTCNKSEKDCTPETVHAIIFGGRDDTKGITEILLQRGDKYEWKKDSEFKNKFFQTNHYHSTVTFENRVYTFGGQGYDVNHGKNTEASKQVFVFTGKWATGGEMNVPRSRHLSVVVGEKIIHVGGSGAYAFEIWTSYGKGSWVTEKKNTKMELTNWYKHPNVFAVGANDYE